MLYLLVLQKTLSSFASLLINEKCKSSPNRGQYPILCRSNGTWAWSQLSGSLQPLQVPQQYRHDVPTHTTNFSSNLQMLTMHFVLCNALCNSPSIVINSAKNKNSQFGMSFRVTAKDNMIYMLLLLWLRLVHWVAHKCRLQHYAVGVTKLTFEINYTLTHKNPVQCIIHMVRTYLTLMH